MQIGCSELREGRWSESHNLIRASINCCPILYSCCPSWGNLV